MKQENINNICKISVVVPVYKVEGYLPQCVDSIMMQAFKEYELFLVDDGTPDSCGQMNDEYAMNDSRIIVIHKQNGGLSDARNYGIDLAAGDYYSFIDSDDYVDEHFLDSLYSAMTDNNCELSICNITTVDKDGNTDDAFYKPFEHSAVAEGHDKYESLKRHAAWNKLYGKRLFQDIRYPKGKLFEDLAVYHYILDKVDKTAYTGLNSYYYRIRTGSIMTAKFSISSTDIVDGYYDRAKFYDSLGEMKLADDAYLWVYSRIADAFSCLDANEEKNRLRLKELKKLYNGIFKRIFINGKFSAKQKLRFLMLFISPKLHELMYSK